MVWGLLWETVNYDGSIIEVEMAALAAVPLNDPRWGTQITMCQVKTWTCCDFVPPFGRLSPSDGSINEVEMAAEAAVPLYDPRRGTQITMCQVKTWPCCGYGPLLGRLSPSDG